MVAALPMLARSSTKIKTKRKLVITCGAVSLEPVDPLSPCQLAWRTVTHLDLSPLSIDLNSGMQSTVFNKANTHFCGWPWVLLLGWEHWAKSRQMFSTAQLLIIVAISLYSLGIECSRSSSVWWHSKGLMLTFAIASGSLNGRCLRECHSRAVKYLHFLHLLHHFYLVPFCSRLSVWIKLRLAHKLLEVSFRWCEVSTISICLRRWPILEYALVPLHTNCKFLSTLVKGQLIEEN